MSSEHLIYSQTLGIFVKKGNDATYQALLKAFEETKEERRVRGAPEQVQLEAAE